MLSQLNLLQCGAGRLRLLGGRRRGQRFELGHRAGASRVLPLAISDRSLHTTGATTGAISHSVGLIEPPAPLHSWAVVENFPKEDLVVEETLIWSKNVSRRLGMHT